MIKPILKYTGGKWSNARWIVSHFPEHRIYIEPYCGSAACFFAKKPSELEILNDLSHSIINLFRMIRDHSEELAFLIDMTPLSREEYEQSLTPAGSDLELAREFLVRCWQAHGTRLRYPTGWWHDGVMLNKGSGTGLWAKIPQRILTVAYRLKQAQLECRPALDIIGRYNAPHTLLYVDPPYVLDTRSGKFYEHEMTDAEHLELLDTLDKHTGPVVLSGYSHHLYDNRLKHWYRVTVPSLAEHGKIRTEVLWLNQKAAQSQQLPLFTESEAVS